jgi:hypothetical protein
MTRRKIAEKKIARKEDCQKRAMVRNQYVAGNYEVAASLIKQPV